MDSLPRDFASVLQEEEMDDNFQDFLNDFSLSSEEEDKASMQQPESSDEENIASGGLAETSSEAGEALGAQAEAVSGPDKALGGPAEAVAGVADVAGVAGAANTTPTPSGPIIIKAKKSDPEEIISEYYLRMIRRKMYEFYVFKKEVPTIEKLQRVLKREVNFTCSRKALCKVLRDDGFRFGRRQELIGMPGIPVMPEPAAMVGRRDYTVMHCANNPF